MNAKKLLAAVILAVILVLSVTAVAQAATVSQSTIDAIIEDAKDGTLDGDWTAKEINAARKAWNNDPILVQYNGDFPIPPSTEPPIVTGELAFTGAPLGLMLVGGLILIVGGVALRRQSH